MPTGSKPVNDATLVRVLKALAHAKRFQMVQEIARKGELSCGQIGELFPVAQPTISHHLKILHDAGLLLVRRQAQHAFISVDRALIEAAVGSLPTRLAPAGGNAAKGASKAGASVHPKSRSKTRTQR